MITITIIAPSPLVHRAFIVVPSGKTALWRAPIVKPQHYLACHAEQAKARREASDG